MIVERTSSIWQHKPVLPPDATLDIDALRPLRIVRVQTNAERLVAVRQAPAYVRIMFVNEPEPPLPLERPLRPAVTP